MPGLFEDIMSENMKIAVDGCGVVRLLDTLDKEDRSDLIKALDNTKITGSAIHRALQKNGHEISGNTIRRHRRKDCPCGKAK